MSSLPLIAIVGRPNVGKSTLFNQVVGQRMAIVHDQPGVTRDRCLSAAEHDGRRFLLVDTAGIEHLTAGKLPELENNTRRQTLLAMDTAELVWFLVDGREGIQTDDRQIINMLRKAGHPFILVVNKVDPPHDMATGMAEFHRLGAEHIIATSSEHKRGLSKLLSLSLSLINAPKVESLVDPKVKLTMALVGRPNSGKSSLLNALLGKERAVVSPIAGTTRDTIADDLHFEGQTIRVADTAGLRRRSRVQDSVEYYSTVRAMRAIEEADVCVLLADPTQDTADQERRLAQQIWEAGKGLVIAVSKKDVFETPEQQAGHLASIQRFLHFIQAPTVHISSTHRKGLSSLLKTALAVAEQRKHFISTNTLTEFVRKLSLPRVTFGYASQERNMLPPTFHFFGHPATALQGAQLLRQLETRLREAFPMFNGVPVRIHLEAKNKMEGTPGARNPQPKKQTYPRGDKLRSGTKR